MRLDASLRLYAVPILEVTHYLTLEGVPALGDYQTGIERYYPEAGTGLKDGPLWCVPGKVASLPADSPHRRAINATASSRMLTCILGGVNKRLTPIYCKVCKIYSSLA